MAAFYFCYPLPWPFSSLSASLFTSSENTSCVTANGWWLVIPVCCCVSWPSAPAVVHLAPEVLCSKTPGIMLNCADREWVTAQTLASCHACCVSAALFSACNGCGLCCCLHSKLLWPDTFSGWYVLKHKLTVCVFHSGVTICKESHQDEDYRWLIRQICFIVICLHTFVARYCLGVV